MNEHDIDLDVIGYSCIGFLTIATVVAIVRAIVLTIDNSTPEGFLYTLGLILILLISGSVFYWTGRLVVYLLSFLD